MAKKCGGCGPGFATPLDAFRSDRQEKCVYIPCIVPDKSRPDYIVTVDVDPNSQTYSKVIHRLPAAYLGDELHHTGWNACSSCYGDATRSRSRLIVPALGSSRIYVVDTATNPRKPKIDKVIEPWELHKVGCSTPHTTHCLGNGDIMISTMGDDAGPNGGHWNGNAQGNFVLVDGKSFKVKGTWPAAGEDVAPFGYDFWYQPYHNVLIATEWGHPRLFSKGLDLSHVEDGKYGTHLNVYDWTSHKLIQRIDLGSEGVMPLEIRFLHNPRASEGFVGCALFANVFRFYKTSSGDWAAEKVLDIPAKGVEGWILPDMPAVMTDIIISMDDKYLYFSNWLHGDIRQYDITDTRKPKLVGQIFLGGSITAGGSVKVTRDEELTVQPGARYVAGKRIVGAPQMIQLSLNGKRLYVTTSLFSPWDRQFYPEMIEKGSMLLQVDIDTEHGGLSLNEDFLVDFGDEPDGPVLAHEIRYEGGDCTSDIYVTDTEHLRSDL